MARRKRRAPEVEDYRHDARRKNIPPAGLAAHGEVKEVPGASHRQALALHSGVTHD